MKTPRLMVIGLDAVSLSLLESFRKNCPTIHRQMKKGASGRAIPSFPIYTPTNWAVLCTGAESSTTGAVDWHREVDGKMMSTFDHRALACDTVFDSAARAGLKTLAITYPGAYPPASPRNMVLCPLDRGLVSQCLVPGKIVNVDWSGGESFGFDLLQAPGAVSGAAMAKSVGATEDGGDLRGKDRKVALKAVRARLFRAGKGAWTLGLDSDPAKARLALAHEQWSEPIPVNVSVPGRPGRCVLRVMVFDKGRRLAVSEAYDIGMLGTPARLANELHRRLGPPVEHSVFLAAAGHKFWQGTDDPTLWRLARKELEEQARWIVDAAKTAMKIAPYDVFYLHHHLPDNLMHSSLAAAEGAPDFTPSQHRTARKAIAMALAVCDGLIAGLLRLAGPKTTVLLVSDHGDVPNRYAANVYQRLKETGLLVDKKDGSLSRERSAAWPVGMGIKIAINAKPGTKKYEQLQARVIDALLDWKTAEGERVIALALRKKDAHLLGYHGPDCGDVVFHYNSGFYWAFGKLPEGKSVVADGRGANHGPQMPVTFSKLSDNMSYFVLTGPRVKKGLRWDFERRGHVKLIDMVPTACHVAEIPTPLHAAGAVRRELLA